MRRLRLLFPPLGFWLIGSAAYIIVTNISFDIPVLPSTISPSQAQISQSEDIHSSNVFRPIKVGDYRAQILKAADRPLFSETRKPPAAANEEMLIEVTAPFEFAPEPLPDPIPEVFVDPTPPDLIVLGYIDNSAVVQVLIFDKKNQRETWFEVGDIIQDWAITQIAGDGVRFIQDDFEYVAEFKN